MIKTILFDLGNVIVFVSHKKIAQGLAKFSDKSESYIYHFFLESIVRKGFDLGKISAKQIFIDFKDKLNLKLNFEQFKKIWASCFTPNKEMEKLLHKLKKNYNLVLLSNTDEIHFEYCRKNYKVLDIFDDFVLSYKVGHRKPSPLIYLYAIKKTGRFPSHLLYVDDINRFVKTAGFFGIKSIQYKDIQKFKTDLKRMNVKI